MSFAKMIDDCYEPDFCEPPGAPTRQILFVPIENQMAGDQGSDPSQSGGSYSEEPNIVHGNYINRQQQHSGILRNSHDNAAILKRASNISSTVSFQNRMKRATSIAEKKPRHVRNQQSLDRGSRNLSILSKPTSEAGYSVMTMTGETP